MIETLPRVEKASSVQEKARRWLVLDKPPLQIHITHLAHATTSALGFQRPTAITDGRLAYETRGFGGHRLMDGCLPKSDYQSCHTAGEECR